MLETDQNLEKSMAIFQDMEKMIKNRLFYMQQMIIMIYILLI